MPQQTHRHHRPEPVSKTSWEGVSDWYADYLSKPSTLQADVVFPGTLRLLKPQAGGHYLDIACGEGAFSRLLAREPGVLVDGIDAAPSLIEKAKKLAPRKSRYYVADEKNFAKQFTTDAFDGATCILAIQNIDPIAPVFRDAQRVLKAGAPLVIIMT